LKSWSCLSWGFKKKPPTQYIFPRRSVGNLSHAPAWEIGHPEHQQRLTPQPTMHNQTIKRLALLCLILAWIPSSFAQIFNQENPVVAKIGSKELRLNDIEDKQINDLRKQLFDKISAKIKERAIKQLAFSDSQYSKSPNFQVTDSQIKEFYTKNNLSTRGSYEKLAPQIKQYMVAQQQAMFGDYLYNKAQKEGLVTSMLQQPGDFLVQVALETGYTWSNKKGKVMLLEFSDYQCPFCARVQPTLKSLRKKYGKQVTFAYRHLPLPFHKEADEASIAAECARDQGKFEAIHDLLYKNPKQQFIPDLKRYARQVGVDDLKKFDTCLDQDTYRSRVNHDKAVGASLGMNGTPSFAIGLYDPDKKLMQGEILSGALPEAQFIQMIEKYLNK